LFGLCVKLRDPQNKFVGVGVKSLGIACDEVSLSTELLFMARGIVRHNVQSLGLSEQLDRVNVKLLGV
jgi:hypothetical protein